MGEPVAVWPFTNSSSRHGFSGSNRAFAGEREDRRLVEGPYAIAAAGANLLVLADREVVCLAALNHFEGDRTGWCPSSHQQNHKGPSRRQRSSREQRACFCHAIQKYAAWSLPSTFLPMAAGCREPRINIDINIVQAGERNIKLRTRTTRFSERNDDRCW